MKNVVITAAKRTPVGSYLKSLRTVPPEIMMAQLLPELVIQNDLLRCDIEHIILGNVLSTMPNIARVASLIAGFDASISAYVVNRLCASSLQAVINATQSIMCEETNIVIAGGVESLSRAPYYLSDDLRFKGIGHGDSVIIDSFGYASANAQPQSLYPDLNMGLTAENIAKRYGITRERQDKFAFESQQKYKQASELNLFADEILPLSVIDGKNCFDFSIDEHPRSDITLEQLSNIRPAFLENGTVTAGNSSGLNDGASAVILMSESESHARNIVALARVVSYGTVGIDPKIMGLGVVPAVKIALQRANLSIDDIDLLEINEAFASQVIGCLIELGIDSDTRFMSRLNVNGGAIAHGHALANSGTRMLTTLIYELRRSNKRYGLVSMCVGGGQGVAIIIENIKSN